MIKANTRQRKEKHTFTCFVSKLCAQALKMPKFLNDPLVLTGGSHRAALSFVLEALEE